MLYSDYKCGTKDGKAHFLPSPWPGLLAPVAEQKAKYRFYINQGRLNEVWQTGCHNKYDAHVKSRYPMAVIEMNPQDATELGVEVGDIVKLFNDYGATYAMTYADAAIRRNHTFMQFGWFNGIAGDAPPRHLAGAARAKQSEGGIRLDREGFVGCTGISAENPA